MNDHVLRAPSKTFFVGEYVALVGGPALILNTSPFFELRITTGHSASNLLTSAGISEHSPAGKLFADHQSRFKNLSLKFIDPYKSAGGLGASSAQFVLIAKCLGIHDPWELLNLYKKYAAQKQGVAPSGADVIAQWTGGITFFHPNAHSIEKLNWPFSELKVALIHTGQKIATHEHLANINQIKIENLDNIVTIAYHALKTAKENNLIQAVNNYATALEKNGYVAKHTKQLLQKVRLQPFVLACKGCGALGSDVILIIFRSRDQKLFSQWIASENLFLLFCDNVFSDGVIK